MHDFDNQTGALTFLYQVKGEGTHKLAALKKGDTLTVTGPCGNGFDAAALAGSTSASPWWAAASAPRRCCCSARSSAGGRAAGPVRAASAMSPMAWTAFVPWCPDTTLATDSGAEGHHGLVTDLLDGTVRHGADLRPHGDDARRMPAVRPAGAPCVASLERKMACGLGACLGCTCRKIGPVTVCKDGPVFNAQEVFD